MIVALPRGDGSGSVVIKSACTRKHGTILVLGRVSHIDRSSWAPFDPIQLLGRLGANSTAIQKAEKCFVGQVAIPNKVCS